MVKKVIDEKVVSELTSSRLGRQPCKMWKPYISNILSESETSKGYYKCIWVMKERAAQDKKMQTRAGQIVLAYETVRLFTFSEMSNDAVLSGGVAVWLTSQKLYILLDDIANRALLPHRFLFHIIYSRFPM